AGERPWVPARWEVRSRWWPLGERRWGMGAQFWPLRAPSASGIQPAVPAYCGGAGSPWMRRRVPQSNPRQMSESTTLKRTPFYDIHVAAGAKMVSFAGFEMPIQYPAGITAEHNAVRNGCGVFDV